MFHVLAPTILAVAIATWTAPSEQPAVRPAGERNPRVLFITSKDCARCDSELARLRRAGGDFEKMQAIGWKIGEGADNHLQIVDQEAIPELIAKLDVREFPTVACISAGEIVRSFKSGCTTPLDAWTFGFLAKGVDERPAGSVSEAARVETTGHYPLRGNHWSIDEDWNPSKEKVVSHLRGPTHGHQILKNWEIKRGAQRAALAARQSSRARDGGRFVFQSRATQRPIQRHAQVDGTLKSANAATETRYASRP
jgi:hypothetical protein